MVRIKDSRQLILRVIAVLITIGMLMGVLPLQVQAEYRGGSSAEASALIDVNSGRILWSKSGDKPLLIASTTKILTAIVAIENGNMADVVKVSENAYRKEGSSIYLELGEEMSLEHLLYGLMLRSGNDAAVAIAEHVGGSLDGFAHMMNEYATFIGMKNSHFTNPHGLNDEDHYSTAEDMAKLTAYALRNPLFRNIVKTKVKRVPNPNANWDYTWYNKNKLLSMYSGADGVKTGYTKKAGRALVSSATRDGQQLAVVTLNDPNDWVDHARLFDYGFAEYQLQRLVTQNSVIGPSEHGWVAGTSFDYPLAEGEHEQVTQTWVPNEEASIDRQLGIVGHLSIELAGNEIGRVPVYDPQITGVSQTSSKKGTYRFTATASASIAMPATFLQVWSQVWKELMTW